jgi:hypothetical protein
VVEELSSFAAELSSFAAVVGSDPIAAAWLEAPGAKRPRRYQNIWAKRK